MLEKIKKYKFLILVILISLVYFILTSVQNCNFIYYAGYDDFYILSSAYHLLNLDWLGPFTTATLTKGIGAPIFIAMANLLGISLLKAQTFLYIGACILFVYVLKHIIKNDWIRLIIFIVILFNPILYEVELLRVYRDNIYISFLLYVISCAFGIFFNYKEKPKKIVPYMIGFGIFVTWMAITREETIWITPFTIGSSIITCLFIIFDKNCFDKVKKIALYIIPISIYAFSIILICSLNKYAYGEFIRIKTSSKPFKEFMKAITSVDVENPNILVSLSREARMKLYDVSPSFAELREFFEESEMGEHYSKFGSIEGEIEDGWLSWAILTAIKNKGDGESLVTLNNYFRRVTKEVNNAYNDGRLKKEDNPASILDKENLEMFWNNFKKTYDFQIGMKSINIEHSKDTSFEEIYVRYLPKITVNEIKLILERENMFKEITGNISTNDTTYNYSVDKIKLKILKLIVKLYEIFSKPLFIISLVIYILGFIRLLLIKPRFDNYKEMIVLSSLLMLHFIRAVVIAYTETSMCPAINVMYLSSTYGLQFLFGILGIFFGIKWITDIFKNQRKKGEKVYEN